MFITYVNYQSAIKKFRGKILDETDFDLKGYGDPGGVHPPSQRFQMDHTLLDLQRKPNPILIFCIDEFKMKVRTVAR